MAVAIPPVAEIEALQSRRFPLPFQFPLRLPSRFPMPPLPPPPLPVIVPRRPRPLRRCWQRPHSRASFAADGGAAGAGAGGAGVGPRPGYRNSRCWPCRRVHSWSSCSRRTCCWTNSLHRLRPTTTCHGSYALTCAVSYYPATHAEFILKSLVIVITTFLCIYNLYIT